MLLPLLLGQGVAGTGYTLTALGGSYSLAGASVGLLRARYIASTGGSYTQTGGAALLKRSKYLAGVGGAYSLAGSSASILRTKYLSTTGGSYSHTGANAVLLRSRFIFSSGGVYSKTGQIAVITYTPGIAGYTLTALGGSYVLIGATTSILRTRILTVAGGIYSYNTNECYADGCYIGNTFGLASINIGKRLSLTGGSYSIFGQAAFLYKGTGPVWPLPEQVLLGTLYGPTGIDYVGTLVATGAGKKFRYDVETGNMVMILNDSLVKSL